MGFKRSAAALGFVVTALAAVHCSSDVGSLRLGLYVEDLQIPEDTNLMGLYVAEQQADGSVGTVHAFEAAPLRDENRVYVPFPASLVLVSGKTTAAVHARLVAFHVEADGTRTALTMREARTTMPTDSAKLVRMSLFWHAIGNVSDEGAGAPIATAADGVTLQDTSGSTTSARFFQLHSLCDGGVAPEGKTAGTDGHCVSLDVEAEPDRVDEPLPGSSENDPCFDFASVFAGDVTRADSATRIDLPGGACSFQIPPALLSGTYNVGVRTAQGLRPLPAELGVRRDGDRVVLPPVACAAAAQLAEVLLAPSADPWTGAFAVCAEWNSAKAGTTLGNPAPDGGPSRTDATVPDGAASDAARDADAASIPPTEAKVTLTNATDFEIGGVAASGAEVVLTLHSGEDFVVRAALLHDEQDETVALPEPLPVVGTQEEGLQPRAVTVGDATEFYLEQKRNDSQADAYYVTQQGGVSSITVDTISNERVVQFEPQKGGLLWGDPVLHAALFDPAAPSKIADAPDLLSDAPMLRLSRAVAGGGRLVGSATVSPPVQLFDCTYAANALSDCSMPSFTPANIGGSSFTVDSMAMSGGRTFLLVNGNGTLGVTDLVQVGPHGNAAGFQERGLSGPATQLVGGPNLVCFVLGEVDETQAYCLREITGDPAPTPVPIYNHNMHAAALSADATYLYVAYRCSDNLDLHVHRLPWTQIETQGTTDNACMSL